MRAFQKTQRQATHVNCKLLGSGGRSPTPALQGALRGAALRGPLREASELSVDLEWGGGETRKVIHVMRKSISVMRKSCVVNYGGVCHARKSVTNRVWTC